MESWNRQVLYLDSTGGSESARGAVKKINPQSGAIEASFPVKFCSGWTHARSEPDLLVGCSVAFDTTGAP